MIVIVSSVDIYPIDCGKKVVLSGFLQKLVEQHGRNGVMFCHIGRRRSVPSGYPSLYRHFKMPGLLAQAWNVIYLAFLTRRTSVQEAFFVSRRLSREIRETILRLQPGLVIIDTVRIAACCWQPEFRELGILYMDDLFSLRYRRMLAEDRIDALGNFGQNLPAPIRALVSFQGIQRWLVRWEATAIERAENRWPSQFADSLLISAEEVRLLQERVPGTLVKVVDPYVPVVIDKVCYDSKAKSEFIFLGSLSLAHNESGIFEFLTQQWPRVRQELPDATLRIIGKHATERIKQAALQAGPSVILQGFVASLDAYFADATALIVPLRFGSGVKLKVLDSLARGVPLVSTPIGVEGISVVNGVHGFIVSRLEDFPAAMVALSDRDTNSRMSQASLRLFQQRYSTDSIRRSYRQIFQLKKEIEPSVSMIRSE